MMTVVSNETTYTGIHIPAGLSSDRIALLFVFCVRRPSPRFFCLFVFVFCFVLFCFCFVLFCFVLFCFVLFCFVLFCFVLFCFWFRFFFYIHYVDLHHYPYFGHLLVSFSDPTPKEEKRIS